MSDTPRTRVPDSGLQWLDEMIVKQNRDYFAAAMSSKCEVTDDPCPICEDKIADAMIKAREAKP